MPTVTPTGPARQHRSRVTRVERVKIAAEQAHPALPRPAGTAAARAERRSASGGGPSGAAAGRGSWYYAKDVSALSPEDADLRKLRRHVRYADREVLWQHSTLERVRKCGRVTHTDAGDVAVKVNGDVAHYAGLTTCGSVWACPVCSAKIRNHRGDEIAEGAARWIDELGGSAYMVTFTVPHDLVDALKPLFDTVANGFRSVISGRAWQTEKERLGVAGTIRSMEVTHGENGWHPHLHVLVFFDDVLTAEDFAWLRLRWYERWSRFITRAGYRAPSFEHGLDMRPVRTGEEAGRYIAKVQDGGHLGNELTRADLKEGRSGSRTPFEVLDDFRWTGDLEDLEVWQEYEKATKGRQCITWSQGLRALLLPDDQGQDKTDEEIAAEEIGGETVAMLPADTWAGVRKVPGLPAAVLDAAESGGYEAITSLLHPFGLAPAPPDRPADIVGPPLRE